MKCDIIALWCNDRTDGFGPSGMGLIPIRAVNFKE